MKSPTFPLLLILTCTLFFSGWPTSPHPAFAQPAPQDSPLPPTDPGWPRTHEKDGQTVVIFQPQIDQWNDHKQIDFRAATAVTPRGATELIYGVISAHADTLVDPDSRTVYLSNIQLDIRFPGQDDAKTQSLQRIVQDVLGGKSVVPVSLDRVLACMESQNIKSAPVKVNLDPPPIYYSDSPAILVIFQGAPQFKPIPGTQLNFAVNTNWDILQDQKTSQYFLLNNDSWLTTSDPVNGPWTAAKKLPPNFSNLPDDANWNDVRKYIPGNSAATPPKVIVSTQPAELIVTEGQLALVPIPGTTLKHVINPEMPLFLNTADNNYYYLVAGRWFKTRNLSGGWESASARLPDDFQKIPPDCAVGYVLASVPGTDECKDAILLASVPHLATINTRTAKLTVTYDGDPIFLPIQGTQMTYAANSPNQVVCCNGQYYCCYQGVWFIAPQATGPWSVCTSVPPAIYTMPPTCPNYNCTYVQNYGNSDDSATYGYTAGYDGEYVATTGTLMFGAGMAVGAAIAGNDYYPYNPCYYSYGCGARYNYAYGSYYRSAAYYGPYGGAGFSAAYNPATGTYFRSASAYGPYRSESIHQAYNPYTHSAASHASGTNGYESWGRTAVVHNGNYVTAGHQTNPSGASHGWVQTSSGKGGAAYQTARGGTVAKTNSGNVYAGKDGNVYQKTDDGQWQKLNQNQWQNAARDPSFQNRNVQSQLNNDAASRSRGNYQANRAASYGGARGGRRR